MASIEYGPVAHAHDEFLERALKREGFREAYDESEDEYRLVRELLAARVHAGLDDAGTYGEGENRGVE